MPMPDKLALLLKALLRRSDPAAVGALKRLILENWREYGPQYAVAFVFMGLVAGCTATAAWMMKDVINKIFVDHDQSALTWLPVAVVVIFLVKGFAAYFAELTLSRVGNRVVADLQKRMFDRILAMNVAFFQSRPSHDLIMRITNNAQAAQSSLNMISVGAGRDAFTILSLGAVMIFLDPLLAAIALIGGPLAFLGIRWLIKSAHSLAASEQLSLATIIAVMRETSQGIKVVKSFQLEGLLRGRMVQAVEAVERLGNRIAATQAIVNPLMETLAGLVIAAVVFYAGWRNLKGGQSPGEFFAFMTALLAAADPARRLSKLRVQLATSSVGVMMMYDLLDTPVAEPLIDGKPELQVGSGEVRLESVDFSYQSGAPVLQSLSLVVPAGKTTALVGPSGAGKSTVFALLQRFWTATGGRILIDGQSIYDVSLASLRKELSIVSQDVFLFEGTIAENINAGVVGVTFEQTVAAAKAAHADDFIRALPHGYETLVAELGTNFSGGQKQRISLARAFLKRAPIILLDEPTSALDSETENIIKLALEDLTKGRTTIVIAHRLTTVANADVIYVIDEGKVAECGTHQSLMQQNKIYTRLCRHQLIAAE